VTKSETGGQEKKNQLNTAGQSRKKKKKVLKPTGPERLKKKEKSNARREIQEEKGRGPEGKKKSLVHPT